MTPIHMCTSIQMYFTDLTCSGAPLRVSLMIPVVWGKTKIIQNKMQDSLNPFQCRFYISLPVLPIVP